MSHMQHKGHCLLCIFFAFGIEHSSALFHVFFGGIKPMIPLVHGSCSFARIALANIQAGAHWISAAMMNQSPFGNRCCEGLSPGCF